MIKSERRQLFEEYRARPSRDSLLALLGAYETPLYNLSFQIFRHTQDSEDAAQEALLEILQGVNALPDFAAFERWVYRVATNTALDARKKRARRGVHETRGAALRAAGSPSQELVEAVHEALGRLEDDLRRTVILHYFERRTLEEMAAEEGCSTAAVWKRAERGKERLRQALAATTLGGAALALDDALLAAEPVSAPTRSLLTSSMATPADSAAPGTPSVLSFGGIALKAKTFAAVGIALLALVVLVGYAVRSREEGAGQERPQVALSRPKRTTLIPSVGSRESAARAQADAPAPSELIQETADPADPDRASSDPVLAAIRWFMGVQNKDGSWGEGVTALDGHRIDKVGITGLSLLAFLGAGYSEASRETHAGLSMGDAVKGALQWLVHRQREDGAFPTESDSTLNQAIAAVAVNEAYGLTGSASLKEAAQKAIQALEAAQQGDGSWGDPYQSLWASMAVKSAQLSGLLLENKRVTLAQKYFTGQLDAGPCLPAMIGYIFLKGDATHPSLAKTTAWISETPANWTQQSFSYWYLGSFALFQYDGPKGATWNQWKEPLRSSLVPFQQKEGYWWGSAPNETLVKTSLASLALEILNRYSDAARKD